LATHCSSSRFTDTGNLWSDNSTGETERVVSGILKYFYFLLNFYYVIWLLLLVMDDVISLHSLSFGFRHPSVFKHWNSPVPYIHYIPIPIPLSIFFKFFSHFHRRTRREKKTRAWSSKNSKLRKLYSLQYFERKRSIDFLVFRMKMKCRCSALHFIFHLSLSVSAAQSIIAIAGNATWRMAMKRIPSIYMEFSIFLPQITFFQNYRFQVTTNFH
jgi:hypothetical protein